jgi:hypothetical protein
MNNDAARFIRDAASLLTIAAQRLEQAEPVEKRPEKAPEGFEFAAEEKRQAHRGEWYWDGKVSHRAFYWTLIDPTPSRFWILRKIPVRYIFEDVGCDSRPLKGGEIAFAGRILRLIGKDQ